MSVSSYIRDNTDFEVDISSDDADDRESVTYGCSMCEYRDELDRDYGTVWHYCGGCETNRFFTPVEEQPAIEKV